MGKLDRSAFYAQACPPPPPPLASPALPVFNLAPPLPPPPPPKRHPLELEVDSRAASVHRWDEGVEGNTPYVRASDSGVRPKVGKLGGALSDHQRTVPALRKADRKKTQKYFFRQSNCGIYCFLGEAICVDAGGLTPLRCRRLLLNWCAQFDKNDRGKGSAEPRLRRSGMFWTQNFSVIYPERRKHDAIQKLPH